MISWFIWKQTYEIYDHHENTKLFQDKFHDDKKFFKETLQNLGNLFLEQGLQLFHIISKKLLDKKAVESVKCAKYIWNYQFKLFVRECLIEGMPSLSNTIKKNSLALYRQRNSVVISTSKQKRVSLSSDFRLSLNLYLASQARESNLDKFFGHANYAFPVSIRINLNLRNCCIKALNYSMKSQLCTWK